MRHMLMTALLGAGLSAAPALAQYPAQPYVPPPPPNAYGQTGDPNADMVANWYRQFLNREPESGGLTGWVNELRAGTSPDMVEAQILGSEEFYRKAGSTPQGYVNALFQKLANRPATPGEMKFWTAQINVQGPITVARGVLQRLQPNANPGAIPTPVYPLTGGYNR